MLALINLTASSYSGSVSLFTSDNGGSVCFRPHARDVRLSVCVQDYSKMRAWIWMKCCLSTDVGTRTNWLTFEPDPDHSPDAGIGLLSPVAYALQRGILLRRENPYWALVAAATHGFWVVCTATWHFITSGKSHVLLLGARRSSDTWFWGIETPLSGVNVLYRVHF